jgi:DNA-binding transcriptional ArsR family regulator
MPDSDKWDEISYVISSQYRIETLKRLSEGPATPSLIANDQGMDIAHISRALQELKSSGLVTLLVSEERKKGRVYGITEQGSSVWKLIERRNMT